MNIDESRAAAEAIRKMTESFDYDAKEIFFAMWADMVGVHWNDLTTEERKIIMQRMNYAWSRAVRP